MEESLDLKFLGPPEISLRGQPVKFATRKALALFIYLVVERGAHPREKLQAIFWAESDTVRAQSSLRSCLARIKSALPGLEEPLWIESDRIEFNHTLASSLDLDPISNLPPIRPAERTGQDDLAQMQFAVDAARGPFLESFSLPESNEFNQWVSVQRNFWRVRLNLVYADLSNLQLEMGAIQPAIRTASRWLAMDKLNEIAHRRLMRLHFLNGDRASALQAYESCRDLLDTELGVEPSPETEELIANIRAGSLPVSLDDASQEEGEDRLKIPFVGRAREYQALLQAFRETAGGAPQVVILSGDSGIGKTRLSEEFLLAAVADGADVLHGRCFETSQLLPYQPIVDALRRRLEREHAPEDLLDDVWLVELSRVLPELRERYPDLGEATGDDAYARSRLFEAIARLGNSLSMRRPFVLLIDDMQWADSGTLDLLAYLVHSWHAARRPILLLVLVRSENIPGHEAVNAWMDGLARKVSVGLIPLAPVEETDILSIVESLAGDNPRGVPELSSWLIAETNGQPFFLVETLATLDDYGALVWVDGGLDADATLANLRSKEAPAMAASIHDVILARLQWLSTPAAALLAAAAVIGRPCTFESLDAVSGESEQGNLEAVDELLNAGLLLEDRHASRPYLIAHDRIRDVVYANLSLARQRVFHRRTLAYLARGQVSPAEMSFHALAAKEWLPAFDYSLAAGDEAMRLFEISTALNHYGAALTLLRDQEGLASRESSQHLHLQVGKSYELLFRYREALDIYEELQDLAEATGSREMELAALVARCLMLPSPYETQNIRLARKLAPRAAALAESLANHKALAQIELSLARSYKFGEQQLQPSLVHYRAAEGLADQAGMKELLALIKLEIGVAFMYLGKLDKAEEKLTQSMSIYQDLNVQPRVLSCLHNLAIIRMECGELSAALDLLDQAHEANKALGSPTSTLSLTVTQNVNWILLGRYDLAIESLLASLDLAEKTEVLSAMWIEVYQQLAWCCYDLGAYEQGIEYCQKAISYHGGISFAPYSPAYAQLAMLHIRRGDLAAAGEAVTKGWESFDLGWGTYPGWLENRSILEADAALALAKGDLDNAQDRIAQLIRKYADLGLQHFLPIVLRLRAGVELAAGSEDQAYQSLSEALASADEMGTRCEVWAVCWELAQLEKARGEVQRSGELKARALAEVEFTAAHAGTDALREAFLARADVRQITG